MILPVVVLELPVWFVVLVAVLVLGTPAAMFSLLVRRVGVLIPAAMERSRRRNRRESDGPPIRRRDASDRDAIPETWDDDDNTDLHHLEDLERKRRKQPPRRPGERAPARGSHHDR